MSKRLPLLLVMALVTANPCLTASAAEWVTHVSRAGPDHPTAGQSRFDDLFRAADGHYQIPYPFDALLAQLESVIDNGTNNAVRQVLIPLGRSLQREAAAPDYYRFPRSVAALQGEPAAHTSLGVLEYRLFIAHQPKSESLEVISYNDDAGRFEFQVVDDYRDGGEMRVRQANRLMCLGCHQNAGPIFATRPWSETNFDFRVARRLAEHNPQRYDSFVAALSSDADALDLLTDRANYLAAAQLIWQRGCSSRECRAAALRAMLQYRLSGKSGFEREHGSYQLSYLDALRHNWKRNWPQGLALANSRIPDRIPASNMPPERGADPLSPRPPHARWNEFDAVLADGVIFRLAGFLTEADVRRLDQHLVQSEAVETHGMRELRSPCRLAQVAPDTRLLDCFAEDPRSAPRARLELDIDDGEVTGLNLLSLRLPGDPGIMQPVTNSLSMMPDGVNVSLQNNGGLAMRLANGERLRSLQLHWDNPDLRGKLWIRLLLVKEFDPVDTALQRMLRDNSDSLGDGPFNRLAILADLGNALGTVLIPGMTAKPPLAPRQADRTTGKHQTRAPGDYVLLQAHCGHCHSAETGQPPGFLAAADRERRIKQCAPRILARLLAWQYPAPERIVPMPPPTTVSIDWHKGRHYQRIIAELENLLEQTGVDRSVDTLGSVYRNLDPCVAQN